MRSKIHSYLGFARKSRNLVAGYNACCDAVKRNQVKLLLLAGDLSENTIKYFQKLSTERGLALRVYEDRETLTSMTGLSRGVYGITDQGLAQGILREIDGKGRRPDR